MSLNFLEQLLPGCYLMSPQWSTDSRGEFIKTFQNSEYRSLGINFDIREEFYSISQENVIRGMHFQMPPHDHEKMVYCTSGSVLDVLLDLRTDGYGKVACAKISKLNRHIVYIPRGVAHGFLSLEDNTVMIYKTSSEHVPTHDCGIRWDSFGFDWKLNAPPILSKRDEEGLANFDTFITPF
jgi:dTDP-4-dehydrorhamnose 3,5-epimerase